LILGGRIVKHLVLSKSVLLIGLFVAGQSFVPTAKGAVSAASMAEELSIMETVASATASKINKVGDANTTDSSGEARGPGRSSEGVSDINITGADANITAEPNEENLQAEMLKDIEKAFDELKRGGQREGREWMRLKSEEGMNLVKTVQDQLLNELNVLREIAAEEEAVKTTAAIDKLLRDRQERFERVLKRMEAEDEKMQRKEQRRERRSRERDLDRERWQRRRD
jgi:hypothetical protein